MPATKPVEVRVEAEVVELKAHPEQMAPYAWNSESPTLPDEAETAVTVSLIELVMTGEPRLMRVADPSLARAPKVTELPSAKVRVPALIQSVAEFQDQLKFWPSVEGEQKLTVLVRTVVKSDVGNGVGVGPSEGEGSANRLGVTRPFDGVVSRVASYNSVDGSGTRL